MEGTASSSLDLSLQFPYSNKNISIVVRKNELRKRNAKIKETFWELILEHPITSYVPVQCQSCGEHIVPDEIPMSSGLNDAELGLREEEPSPH